MKFFVGIILLLVCISSCKEDTGSSSPILVSEAEVVDSLPGECPYLTKDDMGNTVLSWVRMVNDSTTSFCYAVIKNGKIFGEPIMIPGTNDIQPHGENLPKIIFKPSGEIIALWGAANPNAHNKYSGLVSYVQSFDQGKTWTNPRSLVTDTSSYDQRYYDVALLPNSEAGIIWLDNRKSIAQEGSGLYFASTEGKSGFTNEKLISQPCCQCCRTDLFVDSKGNIHTLYRGIIQDSIRDMVHIVSADQGKNFSVPTRISDDNWVINGCPHTGPAMAETSDGLQFAWFTGGKERGCFYASSTDNGGSFSPRTAISSYGSHPQLAPISPNEILIVWDEPVKMGNEYFKRIGIQKRTQGKVLHEKQYITADSVSAAYPVITTDGHSSIIAYTANKQEKNFVYYQVVTN